MGLAMLTVAFFVVFVSVSHAQETGGQTTLSGDLENNPAAQEILKKIEKSKRWIEAIQKRTAENLEKQRALEEKKAEVLKRLQDDLKKWESLWEDHAFEKRLEHALENHPSKETDHVYDHHLKFTASKIHAGQAALQKVIENGGGPVEARDAYAKAAKITQAEMIAVNALFNVHYGHAYYNQQVLFGAGGQFDKTLSGEELRKYYLDYRTNPGYLKANPLDSSSWDDLGRSNPDTQCREGHVLVYRTHADDYVCTTERTSEMWVRHGMGMVVDGSFEEERNPGLKELERDRVEQKIKSLTSKIGSMQSH